MWRRRLCYGWRLAITGAAFVLLFGGGFVLAATALPLATLFVRDEDVRVRRAQGVIQASFRIYIGLLRAAGVIRLDVHGAEQLASCRGKLIIANHPTLLDVVLVMSLVPNAQCIVKHELWQSPLLRPLLKRLRYIRNDAAPDVLLAQCRASLAHGNNLVIFPEGTRSVPGAPLRFHRGFAHIATLTGSDLQPIIITCNPLTLVKGQAWYEIPVTAARFRVVIAPPVEAVMFMNAGPRSVCARRLVSFFESYYGGKLKHG